MNIQISVIICTHNPSEVNLGRALEGIRCQTLPLDRWELILVDNASISPVAVRFDLSWHAAARHVREDQLGLTSARLRGIREACGDIIVFVDDDNILEDNYLETAFIIGLEWPKLGVWGGQINPEFETPPPEWAEPFLGMLAIRAVSKEIWSNDPNHLGSQPWGAGMCIRKSVASEYLRQVEVDPIRKALGRTGNLLGGGEDLDLVQTCPSLGMGFGLFPGLRLLHIIPSGRLEENYLLRIHEGTVTSLAILRAVRGLGDPPAPPSHLRKIFNFVKLFRMSRLERLIWRSQQRAYRRAREVSLKHGLSTRDFNQRRVIDDDSCSYT